MARGFAAIYLTWPVTWQAWTGPLVAAGDLALGHRRTGRVTLLDVHSDADGFQVATTPGDLEAVFTALRPREQLTFQWWADDDTDVVCGLSRVDADLLSVVLDFDGLSDELVDHITAAAGALALSRAVECRGVVVDHRGDDEIGWDRVFASHSEPPPVAGVTALGSMSPDRPRRSLVRRLKG